jgi:hypothetical protein
LGYIGLGGVVDHPLLEPFDVEDLHLDHVVPPTFIEALDVHHRHLQLHDRHALLWGEVLEIDDAVVAGELQEVVQQLDEERFVDLAPEDALEVEIGLGIREYRPHGDRLPYLGPRKADLPSPPAIPQ